MRQLEPEVEVWICDPLVIEVEGEGIVFAGPCTVEFAPDKVDAKTGKVSAPELTVDGKEVSMIVDAIAVQPKILFLSFYYGRREGRTLYGRDADGSACTWYVNADAERAILRAGVRNESGVVRNTDRKTAT